VETTALTICYIRLRTFASDWRKEQEEKDITTRANLVAQRGLVIKDGQLTPEVIRVLKSIFSLYTENLYCKERGDPLKINVTRAARLWYRCGIKLPTLDSIMDGKDELTVTFDEFLSIVKAVAAEDEVIWKSLAFSKSVAGPAFEVCIFVVAVPVFILISIFKLSFSSIRLEIKWNLLRDTRNLRMSREGPCNRVIEAS
jgi:uncharacterized protein YqhQ